jgi:hypothetical protein
MFQLQRWLKRLKWHNSEYYPYLEHDDSVTGICFHLHVDSMQLEQIELVSVPGQSQVKVTFPLCPMISRPVCPGFRPPSGTCEHFFFLTPGICLQTTAVLFSLLWGALSEERSGLSGQSETVVKKNGVFWYVTPCVSCKNRRFGGT